MLLKAPHGQLLLDLARYGAGDHGPYGGRVRRGPQVRAGVAGHVDAGHASLVAGAKGPDGPAGRQAEVELRVEVAVDLDPGRVGLQWRVSKGRTLVSRTRDEAEYGVVDRTEDRTEDRTKDEKMGRRNPRWDQEEYLETEPKTGYQYGISR